MRKKLQDTLKIMLLGATLILLPASLSADWVGKIEVSIPFDFIVEGEKLPAGEYIFSTLRAEPNILKVRHSDGSAELTAITTPYRGEETGRLPATAANPRLEFEQFDGKHYLSEVHVPRRSMGWTLNIPDDVESHREAGHSLRTSVEGMENK